MGYGWVSECVGIIPAYQSVHCRCKCTTSILVTTKYLVYRNTLVTLWSFRFGFSQLCLLQHAKFWSGSPEGHATARGRAVHWCYQRTTRY